MDFSGPHVQLFLHAFIPNGACITMDVYNKPSIKLISNASSLKTTRNSGKSVSDDDPTRFRILFEFMIFFKFCLFYFSICVLNFCQTKILNY